LFIIKTGSGIREPSSQKMMDEELMRLMMLCYVFHSVLGVYCDTKVDLWPLKHPSHFTPKIFSSRRKPGGGLL